MMKYLIVKSILIISLFLSVNLLSAQTQQVTIGDINLSVVPGQPFDLTQCSTINTGVSIEFLRSAACGGNILLQDLAFNNIVSTSDLTLSHTFATPGDFIVNCGAGPGGVTTPKACYTVIVPQTVPTMGEWGLIALGLMLLIVMSTAFKAELNKTGAIRA